MKRISIATLLLAVIAVVPIRTFAGGGLLKTLPKDGTWTTYHYKMKSGAPQKKEASGILTLRSVGSTTENGKSARWIELEMKGTENGKETHSVVKFLVNEKHFKSGTEAGLEIFRGWNKKYVNSEVEELSGRDKNPHGMISMLIGGNRNDVNRLKETKTIKYKKGQLKIGNGTTSKLLLDLGPKVSTDLIFDVTRVVWPHENIPFGTAAMELKMVTTYKQNAPHTMDIAFTVVDYGTKAKSALPNKN